ncbi:uncharacterized protein LOC132191645 [Corylus avellana]|uniref:uncharacterized protein LOC132191645 n=1 Tax=Corylus avellana TaxID=13451 RepID=UPI00286CECA8|nr:uncharacterized protein LOC132191645 [Corylus avellana]
MAEEVSNLKDKSVCNDSSNDEQDDAEDDCGQSLEKLNIGPRKKLPVLGLGGLLYMPQGTPSCALNCIMKGLRSKLLFAWDQEECTDSGFKALENKRKPIFLKELKKLADNRRIQYSASNTLLIDDNPYKALLNPPHTSIFPIEYKFTRLTK